MAQILSSLTKAPSSPPVLFPNAPGSPPVLLGAPGSPPVPPPVLPRFSPHSTPTAKTSIPHPLTLRLLNALNSEDRGLKVRFSLATIAFETFELIFCLKCYRRQGKTHLKTPILTI